MTAPLTLGRGTGRRKSMPMRLCSASFGDSGACIIRHSSIWPFIIVTWRGGVIWHEKVVAAPLTSEIRGTGLLNHPFRAGQGAQNWRCATDKLFRIVRFVAAVSSGIVSRPLAQRMPCTQLTPVVFPADEMDRLNNQGTRTQEPTQEDTEMRMQRRSSNKSYRN